MFWVSGFCGLCHKWSSGVGS